MSSIQQTLDGDTAAPAPHLTRRKPADIPSELSASGKREWWCSVCHRRVTRGSEGDEYGHAVGLRDNEQCPHAIGVEAGGGRA